MRPAFGRRRRVFHRHVTHRQRHSLGWEDQ